MIDSGIYANGLLSRSVSHLITFARETIDKRVGLLRSRRRPRSPGAHPPSRDSSLPTPGMRLSHSRKQVHIYGMSCRHIIHRIAHIIRNSPSISCHKKKYTRLPYTTSPPVFKFDLTILFTLSRPASIRLPMPGNNRTRQPNALPTT